MTACVCARARPWQVAIFERKVRSLRMRRSSGERENRDLKQRIGIMRRELRRMADYYIKVGGGGVGGAGWDRA